MHRLLAVERQPIYSLIKLQHIMKYVIKLKGSLEYYQGTICHENHFTPEKSQSLKFNSVNDAKKTIKFHSMDNVIIEPVDLLT